ncbi:MAG: 50S ribosomal protein L13 [bacterium]|nr:50S ribosomal protein L13 [bacterium]
MIPSRKNTIRKIHVIDAEGQVLGRLASRVAVLLRGKHKPTFEMHLDEGDFVKIINAGKIKVTGKKMNDKLYHHHSWHPGGLKTENMAAVVRRNPTQVLQMAISRMLPRTKLRNSMLKRLTLEV